MYFLDASLHNAFIARSMVGIDETKVEYMLNVIHNQCGHLCFRIRPFVAPVDRDLQVKWLGASQLTVRRRLCYRTFLLALIPQVNQGT